MDLKFINQFVAFLPVEYIPKYHHLKESYSSKLNKISISIISIIFNPFLIYIK